MTSPDIDDIESEFQFLEEEYEGEFYGGVFEGSHALGDAVVLRLYSVVPGDDGESLRIETRHHVGGRVVDHSRTERALTDEYTVRETGEPLEAFCRTHHFDDPRGDISELLEAVEYWRGRNRRERDRLPHATTRLSGRRGGEPVLWCVDARRADEMSLLSDQPSRE